MGEYAEEVAVAVAVAVVGEGEEEAVVEVEVEVEVLPVVDASSCPFLLLEINTF